MQNPLHFYDGSLDHFICGFAYGTTSVVVGQPLDTIKTRMQAYGTSASIYSTATAVMKQDGIRGLYRGGVPIVLGGALMRSAQFGVYDKVLATLREKGKEEGFEGLNGKMFGFLEPSIILAGFCGGVSRGVVEGPFEYIKVRRQVQQRWHLAELFNGFGATITRNSFLFGSFVVYIDLSKQLIPGGLGPFWTGAICSNLAWLTVWPMDVAKSQLQSGKYDGKSFGYLIADAARSGMMFRGLLPGLIRSTIANGCAMVAYKETEKYMKTLHRLDCDAVH